jgi:sulfite exporter TauE/SafE
MRSSVLRAGKRSLDSGCGLPDRALSGMTTNMHCTMGRRALGVGTVPPLLPIGKLAGLRWIHLRVVIYKISSILMILVRIYFIFKGILC